MAFELHSDDWINYQHSNPQNQVFSGIMSSFSPPSPFHNGENHAQQQLANQFQFSSEGLSQDMVDPNTVCMLSPTNHAGKHSGVS
jgi:hypothetical protein